MQTDNTQQCAHKVYSVDRATGKGSCLACSAEGQMRFVVEATPQSKPAPVQEPTDAQIALLDPWMRPAAAKELLTQVLGLSQPTEQPAAQEGWKLVPIEPTQEMIDVFPQIRGEDVGRELWADLLAAAPQGSHA